MNPATNAALAARDRSQTEEALYRVAICALLWYPDKAHTDYGYELEVDINWCLAPLKISDHDPALRALIASTIVDPTHCRVEVIQAIVSFRDE